MKKAVNIPTPSKKEVNKYLEKWDAPENYVWQKKKTV